MPLSSSGSCRISIQQLSKIFYFVFVDLEIAFDRLAMDVVWWALMKLDVKERLAKIE